MNPYASWNGHRLSTGNLSVSPRVNHAQLQMDWWLSPTVRRRLLHLGEPNSHEISSIKDSRNSASSLEWKSDSLSVSHALATVLVKLRLRQIMSFYCSFRKKTILRKKNSWQL